MLMKKSSCKPGCRSITIGPAEKPFNVQGTDVTPAEARAANVLFGGSSLSCSYPLALLFLQCLFSSLLCAIQLASLTSLDRWAYPS
jgi:hypothetical protein